MVLHICWCCTLENNTLSLVLQLSRCGHEFNICAIILPEILLSSIKRMISCQILLSPYSFIKDFHIDTVCIVKQPRVNNIICEEKNLKITFQAIKSHIHAPRVCPPWIWIYIALYAMLIIFTSIQFILL